MTNLDPIPLAAMHKGVRFEIKSEKDAMRLLLLNVQAGYVSVEDALKCFIFDTGGKSNG